MQFCGWVRASTLSVEKDVMAQYSFSGIFFSMPHTLVTALLALRIQKQDIRSKMLPRLG